MRRARAVARAGRVLWPAGLFCLVVSPVLAAETSRASEPEASATTAQETRHAVAEPLPIPASAVPLRAREVVANLRRVEALLEPSDEVERIEAALIEETAAILELRERLDGMDLEIVG